MAHVVGSSVKPAVCLCGFAGGLTTWPVPVMGGVIMLACWRRGEPKPAGRPIARPTDDLFPVPAKHTLEREEQQREKWINLSSVKLPGEVLVQHVTLKPHCLFSFIITLYIPLCLPFVFLFS